MGPVCILLAFLAISACRNPVDRADPGDPPDTAGDSIPLTVRNDFGASIALYARRWCDTSSGPDALIPSGGSHTLSVAPGSGEFNIWFTHTGGEYCILDPCGGPRAFSLESGHRYELWIGSSRIDYVVDGVIPLPAPPGSVPEPGFLIRSGTYQRDLNVELMALAPDAEIYYTDGDSEPSEGWSLYSGMLVVGRTVTLRAAARRSGKWSGVVSATYTIHPAEPRFGTPDGHTFYQPFNLTIETATSCAEIRYTVDGSDPDDASELYVEPVRVDRSMTVRAIATLDGARSGIASATYSIFLNPPVFGRPAGVYWESIPILIQCFTQGAQIRYTIDGTEPNASSALYDNDLVLSESATVKAVSTIDTQTSAVVSRTYTVYPPQGDIGEVSAIVAAAGSRYFFGVDRDRGKIHKIDAQEKKVVDTRDLPHPRPCDMEIDRATGVAYILYESADRITLFDTAAGTFAGEYQTGASQAFADADLAIAPRSNRMYVLVADGKLAILELSTGRQIRAPSSCVSGAMIVADDAGHLVSATRTIYGSRLSRYDVSSDAPVLEEERYRLQGNTRPWQLAGSPDGSHLAFWLTDPRTVNYAIGDFAPTDFSDVRGEWGVDGYPTFGVFSPDVRYFYGIGGSGYNHAVHVFRVDNHVQTRAIAVPNASEYSRAAVSPDGTGMLVFTHSGDYKLHPRFWFLENIRE